MAAVQCRPLKRPRLGPPDVYPQDQKQREDELTEENVKKGFSYQPLFSSSNEYGSAKDIVSNVPISKFVQSFNNVSFEKQKINTFQDANKRKSPIVKENFWPVTARSRNLIQLWFQDLAGNKPLTILSKKVPILNKKEEIFSSLCDNAVPMLRAAWFIKMTSAYTTVISEAKIKKRLTSDPSLDWTYSLTKYLRDQLSKLSDYYQGHFAGISSSQHQPRMTPEVEQSQRQWSYTVRLANWLYEESLLDRQEFLHWLLDVFEKIKTSDDVLLKYLVPLILRYVDQIVLSQTLAKSLAQVCTKKLSTLYAAAEQMQSEQQQQQQAQGVASKPGPAGSFTNPVTTTSGNESALVPISASTTLQTVLSQYKNCSQHNSLVLALGAIIQAITICCPGALVWNSTPGHQGNNSSSNSNDSIKQQVLGSPLDRLPMAPSALPMPSSTSSQNHEALLSLLVSEESIKIRGRAVESRWSPDKYQDKTSVVAVNRVLTTLEILDKYDFSRADTSNNLDILHSKIFATTIKGAREVSTTDEAIVLLLCEWCIAKHRVGKHRAFIVAKLLQKRQTDILSRKDEVTTPTEDGPPASISTTSLSSSVWQKVLLEFLDNYAPVVENYQHSKGDPSFAQLVLLFEELIRHEVFSHNSYLCTMISRGDLQPTAPVSIPSPPRQLTETRLSLPVMEDIEECVQEGDAHGGIDVQIVSSHEDLIRKDLSSDTEFTKLSQQLDLDRELLLHQERLQRLLDQGDTETFMDQDQTGQALHIGMAGATQPTLQTVSSSGVKIYSSTPDLTSLHDQKDSSAMDTTSQACASKSQHLQYVTHFPLPHETATAHECNQRLVLLYGVGKARTEAINKSKEITKTLVKNLHDLSGSVHGGSSEYSQCLSSSELSERRAREEQWAALYGTFSSLPCFDQYMAVAECTSVMRDMRASNPGLFGLTAILPSIDQLVFLYDLFELCGDVHGLLEFIACVLMPDEDELDLGRGRRSKQHQPKIQMHPCPPVVGTLPNKSIVTVAMLRKYHSCLVLMPEQIARVFKGLLQTVENIADPAVCTSSERCVLAYLHDIYQPQSYLELKFAEIFSTAYTKIKDSICSTTKPSASTAQYDPKFMFDFFQNPRTKRLDGVWDHLRTHKRPSDVYSFVCNAMMNVCNCQNSDRLYDISVLCAEVTAHYSRLSSEWLGVLKALCCASSNCFVDFLLEVDVGDLSIHESVATFTALMIARHCFSLEDVIYHVALPSLLAALPSGGENQDAEAGARLTCHLLLRLLDERADVMSHDHSAASKFSFKSSPDHNLLAAAHDNIVVDAVLAVLKAMLKLSEAGRSSGMGSHGSDSARDDAFRGLFSSKLDDFIDSSSGSGDIFQPNWSSTRSAMETSNTSVFAGFALQVICSQEWVRERCLHDLQNLCSPELLLDPALSVNQARKLLHLICYPAGVPTFDGPSLLSGSDTESIKDAAIRILQNLDQWSLRKSWLELQLMIKQAAKDQQMMGKPVSKEDMGPLLDAIATGAMSVFVQRHDTTPLATAHSSPKSSIIKGPEWLVAPLISKLSSSVQGRLLKAAGEVLGTRQWWKEHSSKSSGSTLVHTQPFLSLVLACLKGQEDQREGLLSSIHRQITQLLGAPVEERCPADLKSKEVLQEALHLRISLVGAMFDTIQRNVTLSSDWATLLFQLVSSGTITTESLPSKKELLTNVLDMVSVLISVVTNTEGLSGQAAEESRKSAIALFKKLKRELAGKSPMDIIQCKQLLPLPSLSHNVFTVESAKEPGDKAAVTQSSIQGLQINGKQKISGWDLMEGQKNPAPFAWAWFGAVRVERKPLRYEQEFRKLLHHNHIRRKPSSYFTTPDNEDSEDDEDDEKMDAEEGGDKSSQPATPQTPAEAKGQLKSVGTPGTPSSMGNMGQAATPVSQSEQTVTTPDEKQTKAKTTRQRRRPSRQNAQGSLAQQRKLQQQLQKQYLQQPQQAGMMYGQQRPQYLQQPTAAMAGQLAMGAQQQRVGTPTPMDPTKASLHSILMSRNPQPVQQTQQRAGQTNAMLAQLLAQQQQQQQQPMQQPQAQQTPQALFNIQQQLQRPQQQQMQQPTQQLRHLPASQPPMQPNQTAPLQQNQAYSFAQTQRPSSLQIPSRAAVAARASTPNTPTSMGLPTSAGISAQANYGAQQQYQGNVTASQGINRPMQPQHQQQQAQFNLQAQRMIQPQAQAQSTVSQIQQQLQAATAQASMSQAGQIAQINPGGQLQQMAQGGQMQQINQGGQMAQMNQGAQMPQISQGGQMAQMNQGAQMPQISQGGQMPQMTQGGQLPQMSQGGQMAQLGQGGQMPQMNQGGQMPQISQGGQIQQNLQQFQQQAVNRVGMQTTQQQRLLQQRRQQQLAALKQQQQQQQQQQQMPQELMRHLTRQFSGQSQDLQSLQHQFTATQDLSHIQRQLSAPSDVSLQRQVSQQDLTSFQRQMSAPGPQDVTQQVQQQQQQFATNPQFQPGQF